MCPIMVVAICRHCHRWPQHSYPNLVVSWGQSKLTVTAADGAGLELRILTPLILYIVRPDTMALYTQLKIENFDAIPK